MDKIKVVNDPTELVPILMAVDTPVKRNVFKEVNAEWKTADDIEKKFGEEGRDAIIFFEKMKLVETRWISPNGQYPEKQFHTSYASFNISAQWPIYEISDVLAVAVMPEKEFSKIENQIIDMIGENGGFSGDIAEALGVSLTFLKSLVRRSTKLDFRGHRIDLIKDV